MPVYFPFRVPGAAFYYGARVVATPERRVKDRCTKVLRNLGAYYFFPAASPYGRSGITDIIASLPPRGRFIGIECKAKTNKVTRLQAFELSKIERSGGATIVVNDKTSMDDLEAWLSAVSEQRGSGLDFRPDIPPELAAAYLDED